MNDIEKIEKDVFSSYCRMGDLLESPFVITDASHPNHPIIYVNKVFSKMTGFSKREIIGERLSFFQKESNSYYFQKLLLKVHKEKLVKTNFICFTKKGHTFRSEILIQGVFDHNGTHMFNLFIWLTNTKVQKLNATINQKRIHQLAFTDSISSLTNYNYFIHHFDRMVEIGDTGFLFLIQPTGYGNIVDSFGKQAFGKMQFEIANRISELLKEIEHVISRATEGSLIVLGRCKVNEINHYVTKILDVTKKPIIIHDVELFFSVRIGAVSLSFYKGDIDEFVRLSDIALSNTKKNIGNTIVYYREEFSESIQRNMEIQTELVHAIRNKEIRLHLQPKVNTYTGKIESFEALARWTSSKLGPVSPVIFIDIAETIGKIQDIDFLIVEQVLQWLKNRKKRNLKLYQVSVNISPGHFYLPDFVYNITNYVREYGIDPHYIKIELTENIGLVDLDRAREIIVELKKRGFEISIDDFGKGYSSLNYIHQLPVNEIKIDRSFIQQLQHTNGKSIVTTIIQLAYNMRMTAVAEGIETEEQLSLIRNMRCHIAQGFYFYKPMLVSEIDKILKENEK